MTVSARASGSPPARAINPAASVSAKDALGGMV